MSMAARKSRWLMSFADLCLVLLGFFVMLSVGRGDPARLASGMRSAFGNDGTPTGESAESFAAAALFEPREAVLRPRERAHFRAVGARAAAAGKSVRIESAGTESGTGRLDGWELAAARAAAIGRAMQTGGLQPERIAIAIPANDASTDTSSPAAGQRLTITQR